MAFTLVQFYIIYVYIKYLKFLLKETAMALGHVLCVSRVMEK